MSFSKLVDKLQQDIQREQRIEKMHSILIQHSSFRNALANMEECLLLKGHGKTPRCMLLVGESGAGKTTVIEQFKLSYPRCDTVVSTRIPVFSATIPRPATIKGVIGNMLQSISPNISLQRTQANMSRQLYTLLSECKVKLIVLDEFQHMVEHTTKNNAIEVSDWIKTIINETKIPIVLCGLPSAEHVIHVNPQLARRFQTVSRLESFRWPADQPMFTKMLAAIDKELPFTQSSGLSNLAMPKRLMTASMGNMATLMQLIFTAAEIAIVKDKPRIELEDFYTAYDKHGRDPQYNPFSVESETLDRMAG